MNVVIAISPVVTENSYLRVQKPSEAEFKHADPPCSIPSQRSSRTNSKNARTQGLCFSQHVRYGVLAVVTDGNVQFHLRKILKHEAGFTTISLRLRNREILPRWLVKWEESLIRCLFDGPSDCEESEPLFSHNDVQVPLADRRSNGYGRRYHLPFLEFPSAENSICEFRGCSSDDQRRDPGGVDDVDPDTDYPHFRRGRVLTSSTRVSGSPSVKYTNAWVPVLWSQL